MHDADLNLIARAAFPPGMSLLRPAIQEGAPEDAASLRRHPPSEFDAEMRALSAMGHAVTLDFETSGAGPSPCPAWRVRATYLPTLRSVVQFAPVDREERTADTLAMAVDEARSMLRAAVSDVAEHRRRQYEAASEALAAMLASGSAPTR